MDGSSLGNPGHAGGGVVVQNASGDVLFIEAFYFEEKIAFQVEALALYNGLQLCVQHGLFTVEIESDSKVLVQALQSSHLTSCPWQTYDILADVYILLQSINGSLYHVFREANTAADYLACHASEVRQSSTFLPNNLPRTLRGLLFLDRIGCPNIRVRTVKG